MLSKKAFEPILTTGYPPSFSGILTWEADPVYFVIVAFFLETVYVNPLLDAALTLISKLGTSIEVTSRIAINANSDFNLEFVLI
ncbi:MAG: hypothetical protein RR490_09930, partial [Niameybacter sp.]